MTLTKPVFFSFLIPPPLFYVKHLDIMTWTGAKVQGKAPYAISSAGNTITEPFGQVY